MAIPIAALVLAVLAGGAGVASGVEGISKMKDADEKVRRAKKRHDVNLIRYEEISKEALKAEKAPKEAKAPAKKAAAKRPAVKKAQPKKEESTEAKAE